MKQAQSEHIAIQVFPKSGRNAIEGMVTDAAGKQWLKVCLTVVPEDGKDNKALLKLLAKEWKCPVSSLEIVWGETARYKIIQRNSG